MRIYRRCALACLDARRRPGEEDAPSAASTSEDGPFAHFGFVSGSQLGFPSLHRFKTDQSEIFKGAQQGAQDL